MRKSVQFFPHRPWCYIATALGDITLYVSAAYRGNAACEKRNQMPLKADFLAQVRVVRHAHPLMLEVLLSHSLKTVVSGLFTTPCHSMTLGEIGRFRIMSLLL